MKVAVCCALFGLTAAAQTPPVGQAHEVVKPEQRCAVEGTVTDSTTGAPVKKARLLLEATDPAPGSPELRYAGVSDAAGHFVIQDIDPGEYELSVERDGFVDQQYGAKEPFSDGTVLNLRPSQRLKEVDFKLVPEGVITGRVLDEDEEPVQKVGVQALRSMRLGGKKRWVPFAASSTDDSGQYRLFGVTPGRYVLNAVYRANWNVKSAARGASDSYAPTYYVNAGDPATATAVDVTAGGQSRGVDIHLRKTKCHQIRGRVVIPGGTSSVGPSIITFAPKSDVPMAGMARSTSQPYNEKGDFIINNVAPGSYTVTAVAETEGGGIVSAHAHVDVGDSSIEGLTLRLTPGGEISGRVIVEGGQKGTVIANISVELQSNCPAISRPGSTLSGPAKAGGNPFLLTGVQPDVYDVRVSGAPDGAYVKSIRMGDVDVTDTPIDLTAGVAGREISIVIAMTVGQITGSVQNDKQEPAAGAAVVLIPEGKRRENDRFYRVASTDQYGNYTLKNVVPGEYRLFAFGKVEYGAYLDPEWLKPFDSKGDRISVSDGGKQSVQLKLIVTQAQE